MSCPVPDPCETSRLISANVMTQPSTTTSESSSSPLLSTLIFSSSYSGALHYDRTRLLHWYQRRRPAKTWNPRCRIRCIWYTIQKKHTVHSHIHVYNYIVYSVFWFLINICQMSNLTKSTFHKHSANSSAHQLAFCMAGSSSVLPTPCQHFGTRKEHISKPLKRTSLKRTKHLEADEV